MSTSIVRIMVSTVVVAWFGITPAQAYIDPGTGSMLLQMLGAAVAGGIFYFHELRLKIMALLSRRPTARAGTGGKQPADDRLR